MICSATLRLRSFSGVETDTMSTNTYVHHYIGTCHAGRTRIQQRLTYPRSTCADSCSRGRKANAGANAAAVQSAIIGPDRDCPASAVPGQCCRPVGGRKGAQPEPSLLAVTAAARACVSTAAYPLRQRRGGVCVWRHRSFLEAQVGSCLLFFLFFLFPPLLPLLLFSLLREKKKKM